MSTFIEDTLCSQRGLKDEKEFSGKAEEFFNYMKHYEQRS